MLGLPQSTEFNKRIPKQKFYDNLSVTPELKRIISGQIKVIYWRNKIAATTVNIAAGKAVTEVEVFELRLNQPDLSTSVLRLIDREIPYHILYILTYAGRAQAWVAYKEESLSSRSPFKVGGYYRSEWTEPEKLNLKMQGLDMDAVYENFVRQIAGDALRFEEGKTESLKESVERDRRRQELEKQIAALEKKIRNEKQLNRQVELNAKLKKLKKELE